MGQAAKSKGRRGEQEFARWLRQYFPHTEIKRNWESQAIAGGADLYVPPFAIEIKRQEVLAINTWWKQATKQTTKRCPIPTLVFRQNRKKWRFLLSPTLLFKKKFLPLPPTTYVEVPPDVFIGILKKFLK